MLALMIYLLHHMGLRGLATARVCYGLIALIVYLPLLRELGMTKKQPKPCTGYGHPLRASGGIAAMKIMVTAASFSSEISGIQRHAFNLVRCLLRRPEISRVDLVVAPWQRKLAQTAGIEPDARLRTYVADMDESSLSRNSWYYRKLPSLASQRQPDLVHLSYPVPIDARVAPLSHRRDPA